MTTANSFVEPTGETPPIQQAGVSLDTVSKLARLGLVLQHTTLEERSGRSEPAAVFTFMPDSPLGRANAACAEDTSILDSIVDDAEQLAYEDFAARFPKFGPYEAGVAHDNT